MKAGRKRQVLTEKESYIMQMLWSRGPMFVKEMVELYPDPRPHVNTVSTTVRILEDKGYVAHESPGGSPPSLAVARMEDFRERSLADLVRNYFNNSYKSAVSALVEDEKISIDELREIIDIIERKQNH